MRIPNTGAARLMLLALLYGCGGDSIDSAAESAPTRSPLLRTTDFAETAPARYRVEMETSEGVVAIEVTRAWAPLGADRFYNLAKGGFYDDTRIYRVLDNFMAQWGLNGDPYVNQAWKSEFIVDDPVTQSNLRGRVAFAKGGVHTRTTEIFISTKDNGPLDENGFAPFGEVVEGMEIVDRFYSAYGDGPPRGEGPYQAMAAARGNAYFDEEFPELTRIISMRVLEGG
ncbi:MAG: peptidylprolyl isomerase [Gemmatimonadota bacterium]